MNIQNFFGSKLFPNNTSKDYNIGTNISLNVIKFQIRSYTTSRSIENPKVFFHQKLICYIEWYGTFRIMRRLRQNVWFTNIVITVGYFICQSFKIQKSLNR